VFVNGCYWHRHTGCRRATIPTRNNGFWVRKFEENRRRDAKKIRALRALGYLVVLVWECECTETTLLRKRLSKLREPGVIENL